MTTTKQHAFLNRLLSISPSSCRVVSAVAFSDGTPVPGQQFEYNFDDIGNRASTKAGGDETGSNLRSANYAANPLNQYTSRDVPSAIDIIGVALANSGVLVNNNAPYR